MHELWQEEDGGKALVRAAAAVLTVKTDKSLYDEAIYGVFPGLWRGSLP